MGGIKGKLVSGAGNGGSGWGSGLLVHVIVSLRVMSKRREQEFVQHNGERLQWVKRASSTSQRWLQDVCTSILVGSPLRGTWKLIHCTRDK